jgi:tetratricopeptide (TPR) repeat protein
VAFFNIAINYRSSNQQKNATGVSPEVHGRLVGSLDEALKKLSLTEEQKTKAFDDLTKSKGELESIVTVVSGFLEAIYREKIPPDQYAAIFFRLIGDWQTAGVRIDALGASRNLAPRVATLRKAAQQAHATGDIAEAIRLLDEIDKEERNDEQKLLEHQKELVAEIHLRRQSRIATKDAQIPLALATLRHADAAHLIAERIDLSEENLEKRFALMWSQRNEFYVRGRNQGLNADLIVSVEMARLIVNRSRNSNERGAAIDNLAVSLSTLGERESGTARLEEAVAACHAALEEWRRERVPLNWAMTQNNLGNALSMLGRRESGTARLEEAVAAYRAALEEWTHERVPLNWAMTQTNLGNALATLGNRESGTARLEEAVAACHAALEERTRERVPLDWAGTQMNLGNALRALGERESGTARLEEAVAAYNRALEIFLASHSDYYEILCHSNREQALVLIEDRRK